MSQSFNICAIMTCTQDWK